MVDPFDGAAFEHLTRFKCTIVGPRCLLQCLLDNKSVPDLPYPVFTASMRGLIVTSTNFSKERKNELQLRGNFCRYFFLRLDFTEFFVFQLKEWVAFTQTHFTMVSLT